MERSVGEGAVVPDRGPPVRAEIVHQSLRTRVTRLFSPGGALIRKEPALMRTFVPLRG
jgi:hypothetical protein